MNVQHDNVRALLEELERDRSDLFKAQLQVTYGKAYYALREHPAWKEHESRIETLLDHKSEAILVTEMDGMKLGIHRGWVQALRACLSGRRLTPEQITKLEQDVIPALQAKVDDLTKKFGRP